MVTIDRSDDAVVIIARKVDAQKSSTEPAVFPRRLLVQADEKAGMLNDIEAARDVVATERGSCRGTLIGHLGVIEHYDHTRRYNKI